VGQVVDGLVARIGIGLPGACASLDDEAAQAMFKRLDRTNEVISLLEKPDYRSIWEDVLTRLADRDNGHGLIAGRSCRLLRNRGALTEEETARRMSLALSPAVEPARAAAWVEGFLTGSGLLLLHDDALWRALDEWVMGLKALTFRELLPLLRRTFATFPPHERRQMGEGLKKDRTRAVTMAGNEAFDRERAEAALPLAAMLLGLEAQK
jgi:hypothetical protein